MSYTRATQAFPLIVRLSPPLRLLTSLAKKKEEEDRAREAALEQEALDKAAALLEEKLEEKPEASDADVEMGVEVPDEKAVSEVDLDQQIQDAMAEDAAAVEAEQTKVSESAASEEAVSADDTVRSAPLPSLGTT